MQARIMHAHLFYLGIDDFDVETVLTRAPYCSLVRLTLVGPVSVRAPIGAGLLVPLLTWPVTLRQHGT